MKIRFESLIFFCILAVSFFCSVIVGWYAIYYVISFLSLFFFFRRESKKQISFAVVFFFLTVIILILDSINNGYSRVHVAFAHLLLIYSGILFFTKSSHCAGSVNINGKYLIVFLIVAILQLLSILPAPHFPRVTSVLVNPNELSALFLVVLFYATKSYYKGVSFVLTILGGSVAIMPLLILLLPIINDSSDAINYSIL